MKKTRLRSPFGLLAGTVLFASSAVNSQEPPPGYTAHEWGTFTSVQGSDGLQLEWHPLTTLDLPGFVYGPAGPIGQSVSRDLLTKSRLIARQRMETPVIYFYAPQSLSVAVTVDFPEGTITWDDVQVLPRTSDGSSGMDPAFPHDGTGNHYYAARGPGQPLAHPRSRRKRHHPVQPLHDDHDRVVAGLPAGFSPVGRPVAASEIGETLPRWEAALYLLRPVDFSEAAATTRGVIGLLAALLLLAIGVGGWLIVGDVRRQFALARQKTDFVSNVSHDLKTPLTSIRMFSELLVGDRVVDPARRRHFLQIIQAESARLARLINNVLDFARLERGDKHHRQVPVNLRDLVRESVDTYRPHLEASGFATEGVSARRRPVPDWICGVRCPQVSVAPR